MRDDVLSARDPPAIGEGAPDIVLEGWCCGGGTCEVHSLLAFSFDGGGRPGRGERFKEVGDGVDGG